MSASRRFQPGEGPSRGLLRDCTTSPINRFAALILSYWASQNMSHMWDIMWLCPLIYFHFTTTDCCDIVRTNSLLEVVHCVNILQESVIVSFRISISHSWRPGCWAEKHSLQNISSNGIPDPLKLHICCNYFLIAHLNPHHHICSELCYDSGTRNLIGDEIT